MRMLGLIPLGLMAAGLAVQAAGTQDPFADVTAQPRDIGTAKDDSLISRMTRENFLMRYEVFSQFSVDREAARTGDDWRSVYSRQSIGFEIQKKFSSDTKTWLGIDYQGRFARRDNYHPVSSDLMGADHDGWAYETHNAYADFYDLGGDGGRVNFRIGRYYVPFGINLYTDTHGTLMQLSNERNFGFERDWYAGFYGAIGEDFIYDAYYALGSGADSSMKGQSGLLALRLGTGRRLLYEEGLEAGFSLLAGERVSEHATMLSPSVAAASRGDDIVRTWRIGPDMRKRFAMDSGTLTLTGELSAGQDEDDTVLTGLAQVDWLSADRRWGLAAQYRHFWQDIGGDPMHAAHMPGDTDSSVILNASWYFANDVGNANIHAITLGVEHQVERNRRDGDNTVFTLQYYRYW